MSEFDRLKAQKENILGRERSRLREFLYLLIRDELPAGKVEQLVKTVEVMEGRALYSNAQLGEYAAQLALRLGS